MDTGITCETTLSNLSLEDPGAVTCQPYPLHHHASLKHMKLTHISILPKLCYIRLINVNFKF